MNRPDEYGVRSLDNKERAEYLKQTVEEQQTLPNHTLELIGLLWSLTEFV